MYRDEQNKENTTPEHGARRRRLCSTPEHRARKRRLRSMPEHVGLKKETLLDAGARSQKKRAPLYRNKLKLTLP